MEEIDWTIVPKLAAVVILVAANGFFVASEFAIVALRRSRIEELINNRHRMGPALLRANDKLDAYLAATQLGITLSSLGLGWLGKPAVAALIEPIFGSMPPPFNALGSDAAAFVIAFTLLTILHIVFGELLPKSLAIQKAEAVSIAIVRPLAVFLWLFHPAIAILNGFANWLLRRCGLNPASGEQHLHSPDELKLLWRAASDAGLVEKEQGTLVDRALTLGERKIVSFMTPRLDFEWIDPAADFAAIRQQVIASPHSRFPVMAPNDQRPGIVSAKSILSLAPDLDRLPDAVVEPAILVQETANALQILEQFRRDKTELALVLDEYGDIQGLATVHDLYDALAGKSSHAVADLNEDAANDDQVAVEQVFDGSVSIDELRRLLKQPALGAEDRRRYNTAAGFMLERFQHIPRVGSRFRYGEFVFGVSGMSKLRITRLSVMRTEG